MILRLWIEAALRVPNRGGACTTGEKMQRGPEGGRASWRPAEAPRQRQHQTAEATGKRKRAAQRAVRAFYTHGGSRYKGQEIDPEARLAEIFKREDVLEIKTKLAKSDFYRWQLSHQRLQGIKLPGGRWGYRGRGAPTSSMTRSIAVRGLKIMSYNCNSLVKAGRPRYILEQAHKEGIDAVALQGTRMHGPRWEHSAAGFLYVSWGGGGSNKMVGVTIVLQQQDVRPWLDPLP